MTISAQSESGFNVGIDAGKAQLDVVWHETGEHAIVENTVAGIRQLVKRLHKESVVRVVIEATGRYERTFVMAALAAGQVDAYGVGNVPGSALIRRFPERNYEIKVSIPPRNWYSVGVRKGGTDLLLWLNTFVFYHRENGDMKEIYERVIGDELPNPPTL